MERRGSCCIARYGGDADVAWKVDRVMLKFRPIAPKPAAGGNLTCGLPDSSNGPRRGGRGKRKGGGKEGRRGRKARKEREIAGAFREEEKKQQSSSVVTLQLMPETPERKEDSLVPSPTSSDTAAAPYFQHTVWQTPREGHVAVVVAAPRPVRLVGSWVTVECVTDTWRDGEVGGGSDEEVRSGLERDACPGFLSDGWDRVTWTNAAYWRMVVGPTVDEVEEEEEGVRVALVTRGLVPGGVTCRAFTCRVRVRYACRRKGRVSMTVPCDVWRLAEGGLAWRLDVKAALSLSLGN